LKIADSEKDAIFQKIASFFFRCPAAIPASNFTAPARSLLEELFGTASDLMNIGPDSRMLRFKYFDTDFYSNYE